MRLVIYYVVLHLCFVKSNGEITLVDLPESSDISEAIELLNGMSPSDSTLGSDGSSTCTKTEEASSINEETTGAVGSSEDSPGSLASEVPEPTFTELVQSAPPRTVPEPEDAEGGRRRTQGCVSFEANPRDPGTAVSVVADPWNSRPFTCKLFVRFPGATGSCSAGLVDEFMIATARHCTYHGCLGRATEVRVACGYGFVDETCDGYDHYGTALVTSCVRYESYDNGATCVNGNERVASNERDIQICQLDREVGANLGFFGLTSVDLASVNVEGYPADTALNAFIPSATDKKLYRFEEITTVRPRKYFIDEMWGFRGESGGPYYRLNSGQRHIGAVHRGGPTACREDGTRSDNGLVQALLALQGEASTSNLNAWNPPGMYCHVILYRSDVFNFFTDPIKGVGVADPVEKSISQVQGGQFKARISLFNVGTKATTFTLAWYASTNNFISTSDTLLGTQTVTILANQVNRITAMLTVAFPAKRFIGALWSGAAPCFLNDGHQQAVGEVTPISSTVPSNEPSSSSQPSQSIIPSQGPSVFPEPSGPPSDKCHPDGLCVTGKWNDDRTICCHGDCPECGGCNCAFYGPGADGCCPGSIREMGIVCQDPTDTSCIVGEECPPITLISFADCDDN